MLCRWLSLWSVNLNINTLSCQNFLFPEVWGVYIKHVEIPEGWGVTFAFKKINENSGEEGELA